MTYTPDPEILKRYADILVKFALNSGKGVKKGEVVQCIVPDVAKPLLVALQVSLLEAGAMPMLRMLPSGVEKDFYMLANDAQLTFFPKKYLKARVELLDHTIAILADADPHELAGVDPKKIMKAAESNKLVRKWRDQKEYAGKFTWTLALYGTTGMAKEAGLSLKEYWNQIIKACYLDKEDPIDEWKKSGREVERVKTALNKLPIETLRIVAKGTDLTIKLGEKRQWVGGSGRNIPSFEVFTSPDWRGTEGYISFNQPLYTYGSLVREVKLWFKKGRVVKVEAAKGKGLLETLVARPNADKIGEFSLTDAKLSRIDKFMANTLFDENIGGKYGNTHLAVGMSYKDAYHGDPAKVKPAEWKRLGFNWSGEHTDIIATEDRTVTATMMDGSQKVIYAKGSFQV